MTSRLVGHTPFTENESDCCVTCCCSTFCCLCCCANIKKSTRIKLVWTWLLILGILSSVVLSCYFYQANNPYSSPSDMRPVNQNVHFLFCEAVSIDSPGISFDSFAVPSPLTIDTVKRAIINTRTALYVDVYDYNYFSLYLLPGSTLKLQHCSKNLVVFYSFTGLDNFQKWQTDPNCVFCYDVQIYLMDGKKCDSDANIYQEYDLDISKESEMFFVYSNKAFDSAWVDLKLNINRTIYDLSNAKPACTDALECSVSLDGPGLTVVYHVDDGYDLGEANHPKFTTKCVPRVWAYFLIHGMAVLLIGITSSMLIQKLCKDRTETYHRYTGFPGYDGSERTPLMYDAARLPPSYSSVALSPPKYEDIVRTCGEQPPPYLVAVASLVDDGNAGHYVNLDTSSVQSVGVTWDINNIDQNYSSNAGHVINTAPGQTNENGPDNHEHAQETYEGFGNTDYTGNVGLTGNEVRGHT